MRRKLSEIVKEMADLVLRDPTAVPSSEAAHASLLLAHVAWNRAEGWASSVADYAGVLREFEASNPGMWDELRSTDTEELVRELLAHKLENYPRDSRRIVVCGMRESNIRVEWIEGPES